MSKKENSSSLVIVESPAKAKTIGKYLGKGYIVKATMGHIKDLPPKKLGVDVLNDFQPTYIVLPFRKRYLSDIKKASLAVSQIYLASDPDREGEAIGWHLAQELKDREKDIYRIWLTEITPGGLSRALQSTGKIDMNKVNAQQARRILDRLVGYKISPLLWRKVKGGLSAGRVQSVALRLICDRERQIEGFVSEEYWTITANLSAYSPPPFNAKLLQKNKKKVEIGNQTQAERIIKELKQLPFLVEDVAVSKRVRRAPPPFITSTLQQEASRRFGFPVKKTMSLAQRLYEGMEVGKEGRVGLITYMRTDSLRVASEAIGKARQWIKENMGEEYLPAHPIIYKNKKLSQDAHEAIRPTSVPRHPLKIKEYLDKDEFLLYHLIWTRFIASQMPPARYEVTTVDVKAGDYLLRATGSVLKFPGFLKVYEKVLDLSPEEPSSTEPPLPPLSPGESLTLNKITPEQHFTQPPPRYTEASMVKELEEKGIGRPSTYAPILSTIQERGYVRKEKKSFIPTELGCLVTDLLVENFPDLLDVGYTARMEEELDAIEDGEKGWVETLQVFYTGFEEELERAKKEMRNLKKERIATEEVCEKCGSPMVIRWGRFGQFLACSRYPDCKSTRELIDQPPHKEGEEPPQVCPQCGQPLVIKKGKYGKFYACSAYPECKTTLPLHPPAQVELDERCPRCNEPLVMKSGRNGKFIACRNYPQCKYIRHKETGVNCPVEGCQGQLVERRSRKGKVFYGCSSYPKCTFALWHKPVPRQCPRCGSPYMIEKRQKGKVVKHHCPNEDCRFSLKPQEGE
ncbi:MAG: type I DNA topoisomerase [Acidobacteriota bacterium]